MVFMTFVILFLFCNYNVIIKITIYCLSYLEKPHVIAVHVTCYLCYFSYQCYRYRAGSIKESTQVGRDRGATRVFTLCSNASLPPQIIFLIVPSNKVQLIELICNDLHEPMTITGGCR